MHLHVNALPGSSPQPPPTHNASKFAFSAPLGFVTVPHTDDLAVLLLLDLSGDERARPASPSWMPPSWRRVGCPALLAIPGVPLRSSPPSPRHAKTINTLTTETEGCDCCADSAGKSFAKNMDELEQKDATGIAHLDISASQLENAASAAATRASTDDDKIFICIHEGTGSKTSATAAAASVSSRERWFSVLLPDAAAQRDLQALLHPFVCSDLQQSTNEASSGCDLTDFTASSVVCRDSWPLPPLTPTTTAVNPTTSTPAPADSFPERTQSNRITASLANDAAALHTCICDSCNGKSASWCSSVSDWQNLSSYLVHLSRWNKSLLRYLVDSSSLVSAAALSTDSAIDASAHNTTLATGNDAPCSAQQITSSPANVSALPLLRLIFQFWQRVLRRRGAGDVALASPDSTNACVKVANTGNEESEAAGVQNASEAVLAAAVATSPLLHTPTQISRAYFQDALRKQQQEKQQQREQVVQAAASVAEGCQTELEESADALMPRILPSSEEGAALKSETKPGESMSPTGSSTETPPMTAAAAVPQNSAEVVHVSSYHFTPVTLIEQLLLSIDFTLVYGQSVAWEGRPATLPSEDDSNKTFEKDALQEMRVPVLSPSVTFPQVWGAYLIYRMQRSAGRVFHPADPLRAVSGAEAATDAQHQSSRFDVSCSALEVWQEWVKVSAEFVDATTSSPCDDRRSTSPSSRTDTKAEVAETKTRDVHDASSRQEQQRDANLRSLGARIDGPAASAQDEKKEQSFAQSSTTPAASPVSSPSSFQPCWPSPTQPQALPLPTQPSPLPQHTQPPSTQQSLFKLPTPAPASGPPPRSTSHVSFSVSDVQRPYTAGVVAPAVVAAEAAERAAARHRRERAATPPTPVMEMNNVNNNNNNSKNNNGRSATTGVRKKGDGGGEEETYEEVSRPGRAAKESAVSLPPSSPVSDVPSVVCALLQVVPSTRAILARRVNGLRSTQKEVAHVATPAESATQAKSVSRAVVLTRSPPRPSHVVVAAARHPAAGMTASNLSAALSELPSVTHTALPLRASSAVLEGGRRQDARGDTTGRPSTTATTSNVDAAHHRGEGLPSRIESWDSSRRSSDSDVISHDEDGKEKTCSTRKTAAELTTYFVTREKMEGTSAAAASASTSSLVPPPPPPPPRISSTPTTFATQTNLSSSSSMIASEHRLFPYIDDEGDGTSSEHRGATEKIHNVDDHNVTYEKANSGGSHRVCGSSDDQSELKRGKGGAPQADSGPTASACDVTEPRRQRGGVVRSAASFTTVLADVVARVVNYSTAPAPAPCASAHTHHSTSTHRAALDAAVTAAQDQLASLHRNRLLPPLHTLDTLNLLPYYVHVWCYTYDPTTQKNMKVRRLGHDGDGLSFTIGGRGADRTSGLHMGSRGVYSSGGGSMRRGMGGGFFSSNAAVAQTYLQRYTGSSSGGLVADYGGVAAAAAATSQQLLRGLMREGARTLWRGVREAMARPVDDDAATTSTGTAAATETASTTTHADDKANVNEQGVSSRSGLLSTFRVTSATRSAAPTRAAGSAVPSMSASAAPAAATSVYGGGSGSGGRDVTKDPTLYNAVCGLYITEQDIIIRALPTAEVRARRLRARQRQRQEREEQRNRQRRQQRQQRQQQFVQEQEEAQKLEKRGQFSGMMRRPHSTMNLKDRSCSPLQRPHHPHSQYGSTADMREDGAIPRGSSSSSNNMHSRLFAKDDKVNDAYDKTIDGDEDEEDVEETELLLLPRVGLLAITACAVSRAAGGVFAEKYAHKLFLHQEDQVVALRAQQQQQQRRQQYGHGLRGASSAFGLADLNSSLHASTHAPYSSSRHDSADGGSGGRNGRPGNTSSSRIAATKAAAAAAAAPEVMRTHTTLRPFIEEMLQCALQTRAATRAASSQRSGHASPQHTDASNSSQPPDRSNPTYSVNNSSKSSGNDKPDASSGIMSSTNAASTGTPVESRRQGVQRYLGSLFRSTLAGTSSTNGTEMTRHKLSTETLLDSGDKTNNKTSNNSAKVSSSSRPSFTYAELLSRENVDAAAAAAVTAVAGRHDGVACNATAIAFAAAAATITAASTSTNLHSNSNSKGGIMSSSSAQPTLVLKIESKSMPTVWLEFADETTLLYVYHLLETPLRSAAAARDSAVASEGDGKRVEKRGFADSCCCGCSPASSVQTAAPRLPHSLSSTALQLPTGAESSSAAATPLNTEAGLRTGTRVATESRLSSSFSAAAAQYSCFGNRFLSSARRHPLMVPLVMMAAHVVPSGSAPSPFLVAFMKNVSVAMTVAKLGPALQATICQSAGTTRHSAEDAVRETSSTHAAHRASPVKRSCRSTFTKAAAAAAGKDGAGNSSTETHDLAAATTSLCLADTWWLYDPAREFHRQGLSPERWSLTHVNDDYTFCPTYPSRFVVPAAVAAAMESGELGGQHRLARRVEAVSFFYAPTGGALVRSAQPAIARLFVNSATPTLDVASFVTKTRRGGEAGAAQNTTATPTHTTATPTSGAAFSSPPLTSAVRCSYDTQRDGEGTGVSAQAPSSQQPQHAQSVSGSAPPAIPLMDVPFLVLNAFAAAANVPAQQLTVMDLRAVTAAYANMMRGGGTMDMLLYPFGVVEYAGLPNIHDVRRTWWALRQSLLAGPYRLSGEGGPRRETAFVLHGGEPPYAAVVAAAERSAVSARPAPALPSLTPQHATQHPPAPQPPFTTCKAERQPSGSASVDAQGFSLRGEALHPREAKDAEEDDDSGARSRERCLDVVQQAPTAARSHTESQTTRGDSSTHNAGAAPTRRGSTHGNAQQDGNNTGGVEEDDRGFYEDMDDDDDANAAAAGEDGAFSQNNNNNNNSGGPFSNSFFPFSLGGGGRHSRGGTSGQAGASAAASAAAAAVFTSSGSAVTAAASNTTTPAQQEWLGSLAGLLNTAVVAARRVGGIPTDPLYVPAMVHNGAMANCFSYVVGHAFTRFWLPLSRDAPRSEDTHAHHNNEDSTRATDGTRSHAWWSRAASRGSAPAFVDAAVASFAPSAHRTLAQVVFVNCSDGWDRTAQVSVLTQLLLDPYYRTVEGLCILLERELVCFGHPLQRRSTAVRGNLNGGWEEAEKAEQECRKDPQRVAEPTSKAATSSTTSLSDDENESKSNQTDAAGRVTSQKECGPLSPASCAPTKAPDATSKMLVAETKATGLTDAPHLADTATTRVTSKTNEKEETLVKKSRQNVENETSPSSENQDGEEAEGDSEDDWAAWLDEADGEAANFAAAANEGSGVMGADGSAGNSSSPQQQQQKMWQQYWRRAAAAVSDGTAALKTKMGSATTAAAGGGALSGGSSNGRTQGKSAGTAPPSGGSGGLRDASPILMQLLDAIYQLVRLYPACFEFTAQFVLLLLDLHHCGLVSTFAVNTEQQVEVEGVAHGTLSLSQWCALLLSTTASPCYTEAQPSRTTQADAETTTFTNTTGRRNSTTSPSSRSVSPAHSGGPTQAPLTRAAGHNFTAMTALQTVNATAPAAGAAGAETSCTTTNFSSAEASSFQRLDSQFLVNGDDASLEDGTEALYVKNDVSSSSVHRDGEKREVGINSSTSSSSPPTATSVPQHESVEREGTQPLPMHAPSSPLRSTPINDAPPRPSSRGLPQPPLAPQQQQQQQQKQQHLPSLPRAVYSFDYTTRWQEEGTNAPLRGGDGVTCAATSTHVNALGEVGVDSEDDFTRRLLPLSLDALYTSGYLNPEFSLRHNRVRVGPLVDFILPAQLTLWRDAHARDSFWHTRTTQLQHGVGPVDLSHLFTSPTDDDRNMRENDCNSNNNSSPFSKAAGTTLLHLGTSHGASAFSHWQSPADEAGGSSSRAMRGAPAYRWTTRPSPQHRESHALAGAGDELRLFGRGAMEVGSRSSFGATPPSNVSPPGMMNFHIGSDSEDEGEGAM